MNINFHSFSNYAISFRDNIISSLNPQQKKILVIASVAFGILAACYAISRCCFKASIKDGPGKNSFLFVFGIIEKEGEFKNYKLHGQGKQSSWFDSSVKEGNFEDDELLNGKITYPNGDVYEGECKDGKPNGFGKLTSTSNGNIDHGGTEYKGEFKNGKPHGKGKLKYEESNSKKYFAGEFNDGKATIGSMLVLPTVILGVHFKGLIAEGEFMRGFLHGKGKSIQDDGLTREGQFHMGLFISGKVTYPDGAIEEGEFQRDIAYEELHGLPEQHAQLCKGTKTWPDGKVYEGAFKDGLPHGPGKMTHPDGTIEEGRFEKGILVNG